MTASTITQRPQRQDALNDQMFDVMGTLRASADDGEQLLAAFILTHYFGAAYPITDSFTCAQQLHEMFGGQLGGLLNRAATIANRLGCYDAADWLRYRAVEAIANAARR